MQGMFESQYLHILFYPFFKTFSKKPKESSLDCRTQNKDECSIGKVLGSNPNISTFYFIRIFKTFSKKPRESSLDCGHRIKLNVGDVAQWQSVPFAQGRPWVRIPISPHFISSVFSKPFFKKPRKCRLNCGTQRPLRETSTSPHYYFLHLPGSIRYCIFEIEKDEQ